MTEGQKKIAIEFAEAAIEFRAAERRKDEATCKMQEAFKGVVKKDMVIVVPENSIIIGWKYESNAFDGFIPKLLRGEFILFSSKETE